MTRDTALAVAAAKITPCADLREVRDVLRRIIGLLCWRQGFEDPQDSGNLVADLTLNIMSTIRISEKRR